MTWIILVLAGLFEVVWAVGLKYARIHPPRPLARHRGQHGHQLLAAGLAMKTLPLGTAYAIWVGIGTIGAFIAGIVLFGNPPAGCASSAWD